MKKKLLVAIMLSLTGASGFALGTYNLTTQDEFNQWTTIDANADGSPYRWEFNSTYSCALYSENKSKAADDYLISPKMHLEGGKSYGVAFSFMNATTYGVDTQKIKILAGSEASVSGLSTILLTKEGISKDSDYQTYNATFSPESDGDYYIALYLYSGSWKGNARVNKLEVNELVSHPGAVSDLTIVAAPLGENKAILKWTWPSKSDLGGKLDQITGANIYRGTSSSFTANESTLVGSISGEYTVGGDNGYYEDTSIETSGTYYYIVKGINDNGESTASVSAVKSAFIGKDTAAGVATDVVTSAVEGDEKSISLNFTEAVGKNGGYIDPADVKYKIDRYKDGSLEKTVEEAWSGTLPYIDHVDGLGLYYYRVYTVYQGTITSTYTYATSTKLAAGGTYTIPYSETFSNSDAISMFTLFHDSNSSYDWYQTYSGGAIMYYGKASSGSASGAWFTSAGIEMKAGKAYKMSFDSKMTDSSDTQKLTIHVGQGNTLDAFGESNKFYETTVSGSYYSGKSFIFSVPQDGVYNYAFCACGNTAKTVYVDNIKIEEVDVTPLAVENLEATAGENGEMKAYISWTNPAKDNVGADLESLSKAEIYRGDDLIATITEGLVPGEESSYGDEAVETVGVQTYKVIVYNGDYASPAASASTAWVGKDSAIKAITNVTIVADENDKHTISLTFDLPTGKNGGYIDQQDVTYKIERYKATSTLDATLETEWNGELPYVDSNVNGLAKYFYKVYAIYNGTTSTAVSSNSVATGGAMSVPYSETFDSSSSTDFFTMFNEVGDKDWAYYYYNVSYSPKQAGAADAWLVSPAINFEKGKAYELSYDARVGFTGDSYVKDIYAYVGDANTYEVMSQSKELAKTVVNATSYITTKVVFSVPEDGERYIGIRCLGESFNTSSVYFDNLKIVETEVVPMAVSDLAAVNGENGALSVALSWVNPSEDNVGNALESIDKVEIYRGEDLISTIENVAPGSEGSFLDEQIESSGIYTYKLITYVGEKASLSTSITTSWVGMDTPKAPASVTAVLNDDKSRTITFDAVTEGVNGGYFDASKLTYNIIRNDEVIKQGLTETSYVDREKLGLGNYVYGVQCVLGDSEGSVTNASAIQCGDALNLPYSADMTKAATFDLWTMQKASGSSGQWSYSSSYQYLSTQTDNSWAFTPPFYVKPGTIEVKFEMACRSARYPETLYVYLTNSTNLDDQEKFKLIGSQYTESTYTSEHKISVDITQAQLEELAGEDGSIDDVKFYVGFAVKEIGWICYLYSADIVQTVVTGVSDLIGDKAIMGYDKANGVFCVPEGAEAMVYDLSGVCVAKAQGSVAVDRLANGVYVAVVKMADGSVNRVKFIKK